MRQVLIKIPTDTDWIWLELPLFVGLGFIVWLLSRKPEEKDTRRRLPLYLVVGGILGFVAVSLETQFLKDGIPIYGYGLMLFFAFVICTWLAGLRAAQEGVDKVVIQDLAIWLFIGGLVGSRTAFLLVQPETRAKDLSDFFYQFPQIWKGGVIFYGAAIGGAIGYLLAYFFMLRKLDMSTWRPVVVEPVSSLRPAILEPELHVARALAKFPPSRAAIAKFVFATRKLADIVAPSIAVGLCLGRIGCLLNGCCYGSVACPSCPAITFPLAAPARYALAERGYQSAVGFTVAQDPDPMVDRVIVESVEPGSMAEAHGLKKDDRILQVQGVDTPRVADFLKKLDEKEWNRDLLAELKLTVQEKPGAEPIIMTFAPRTLGLHPTQVYESISMFLLFLLLSAYYPFRRRDGEVMALLMICYAVHRYFNELLRGDERPESFEKYTSLILFAAGVGLMIWLWTQPVQYQPGKATSPKTA
jgi:phosphatidylglycerol:prolipoprotein diacylglycerol transferase